MANEQGPRNYRLDHHLRALRPLRSEAHGFKAGRIVPSDTPSGVTMERAEFDTSAEAIAWIKPHQGFYDIILLGCCKHLRRVQVNA